MMPNSSALSSSGSSLLLSSVIRSPCTRMRGGSPAITCRSEPFRICMLRKKESISDIVGLRSAYARAAGQHGRVSNEALELLAVRRETVRVVRIDGLLCDCVEQRLIHELHADVLAGLQLRRNLMRLLGHDELRDRAVHDQDLGDRAPAAV